MPKGVLASLNCDRRRGAALLTVLALLWALRAGGPSCTMALRYERAAIAQGQWWRLASAHWVHLDARHLLLDSAGLVLLWCLYARELRPGQWLLVLAGSTVAIDAGLWWGDPGLSWYLGISGLLHGAWAAGAVTQLLRGDRRGGITMLALLACKLLLEQRGNISLVSAAMPVVTLAHVYGALGGLAVAAALAPRRKPL